MDACSEQQLWCAVLQRAYEDAIGQIAAIADPRAQRRACEEAHSWFHGNGRDFRWTCDAAGFDPDSIRTIVLKHAEGRASKLITPG